MALFIGFLVFSLISGISSQLFGTSLSEVHPRLTWQSCTRSSGCTTQTNGAIVLDANWRWVHQASGYLNCYSGNTWDKTVCSNNADCAAKCALEGADYSGTYGISTSGNSLTLKFSQITAAKNYGSRVFLLGSDSKYELFKLLNHEFTFDVDVSQLPCGLNGALYFTSMDADGGLGRFPTNKAGAKYGTGYCDSKCPRNLKFIDGQANCEGWVPSATDINGGVGNYGSCCHEVDVWEGNSVSTAFTVHPCTAGVQSSRCTGTACDGGLTGTCDPEGCDFNPYRMGNKTYYGPGKLVDSSSKLTVVTQFFTNNNSTTGLLSEIRRLYIQNGKVIQNSKVNIPGMAAYDSITSAYCTAQEKVLLDRGFDQRGGLNATTKAMVYGMVLAMSVWEDHTSSMLWLDSNYPIDGDPSKAGISRGDCSVTSGKPEDVESSATTARVTFSNIKYGDIGSTYTV